MKFRLAAQKQSFRKANLVSGQHQRNAPTRGAPIIFRTDVKITDLSLALASETMEKISPPAAFAAANLGWICGEFLRHCASDEADY